MLVGAAIAFIDDNAYVLRVVVDAIIFLDADDIGVQVDPLSEVTTECVVCLFSPFFTFFIKSIFGLVDEVEHALVIQCRGVVFYAYGSDGVRVDDGEDPFKAFVAAAGAAGHVDDEVLGGGYPALIGGEDAVDVFFRVGPEGRYPQQQGGFVQLIEKRFLSAGGLEEFHHVLFIFPLGVYPCE